MHCIALHCIMLGMKLMRYCHSQVISQVPWLIRTPNLLALATNYELRVDSLDSHPLYYRGDVTVKAGQAYPQDSINELII